MQQPLSLLFSDKKLILPPAENYDDEVCGRVRIRFNDEFEFKTQLIAADEHFGREDEVGEALWAAYEQKKTEEWRHSFDTHVIERANGKKRLTSLHKEHKSYRLRTFFTILGGHPAGLEYRVEDLETMFKIAHEKGVHPNILRRLEIVIKQEKDGLIKLKKIPEYGRDLNTIFKDRFPAAQSESERDKITAPTLFQWKKTDKLYVIDYERAFDLGTITSITGTKRDITEYEGEAKEAFLFTDYVNPEKRNVNLKTNPQHGDMSREEIAAMIEDFLEERRLNFLAWANDWLQENGYKDCKVETVTHSKSQPEMNALHKLLADSGDVGIEAAQGAVQRQTFAVDPVLSALRRNRAPA